MISNDFKQTILKELETGKTMEEVLALIADTANEIEDERASKNAQRDRIKLIAKGEANVESLIDMCPWGDNETTEDILGELLATYVLRSNTFSKKEPYDVAEVEQIVEACRKHVKSLPFIVYFSCNIADMYSSAVSAIPSFEDAKVSIKDSSNTLSNFLREHGLL